MKDNTYPKPRRQSDVYSCAAMRLFSQVTKRSLRAVAFFMVSGAAAVAGMNEKPNIVLFLVDDMGLMDTSLPFAVDAEGKAVKHPLNDYYRTPNMEKLAEVGTRFSTFYAHSVCSPTRASILTGQNSARHRTTNWVKSESNNRSQYGPEMWNWAGPDQNSVLLPRLLQQAGYNTIHAGKAHFGPIGSYAEDPVNLGFEVNIAGNSFGQPGSYYGEHGYGHLSGNKRRAVPGLEPYHSTDTFLTEALTLEANQQIEASVKNGKPFFLYMAHYAVHSPFDSDPRFAKNYAQSGKSKHAQAYATLIEGMDKSLGDLMQKLEALNVADNTLIIFLGDNGSDAPLGPTHGYTSSAPFRGKKATHFEGGMRVPFIAAWAKPDNENSSQRQLPIRAGSIQTQMGTIMDLLPTICNLVGVPLPEGLTLDGHDLKQQLAGAKNTTRKEEFLNHFPHQHRSSYFTSYVKGDWKVVYYYPVKTSKRGANYELYNLKNDPFEKNNLANSNPEKLQAMMSAMVKDLKDKKALMPQDEGWVYQPRLP